MEGRLLVNFLLVHLENKALQAGDKDTQEVEGHCRGTLICTSRAIRLERIRSIVVRTEVLGQLLRHPRGQGM